MSAPARTCQKHGTVLLTLASLALLTACSGDTSAVTGPGIEPRFGSGTYANSGQVNVCIAVGSPAGQYAFSTAGTDVNSVGEATHILLPGGNIVVPAGATGPTCVTVFDRTNPAVQSLDELAEIHVTVTPPENVILNGNAVCELDPRTPVPTDCIGTTVSVFAQYYHGVRVTFSFIGQTVIGLPLFVIGDTEPHGVGAWVNFWGPQWWGNNSVSGQTSGGVNSFKGYAMHADNVCGGEWSTQTGNSSPPPLAIGQPVIVIVTPNIMKSGNTISGTIAKILLVNQDETYDHNVGHHGFGTVAEVLCEL